MILNWRNGGAGGIRTHEWRFCRPLPWATWVPRRTSKYSKLAGTLRTPRHRCYCQTLLFFRNSGELGFPQESRRLFRRSRIDIETRAPLEAGDFRQFRNDLDMPVIVIVSLFADWRG